MASDMGGPTGHKSYPGLGAYRVAHMGLIKPGRLFCKGIKVWCLAYFIAINPQGVGSKFVWLVEYKILLFLLVGVLPLVYSLPVVICTM